MRENWRRELEKHVREEDIQRLNNSWYSRHSPASRASTSSLSSRPYGVLSDLVESKQVSPLSHMTYSPPSHRGAVQQRTRSVSAELEYAASQDTQAMPARGKKLQELSGMHVAQVMTQKPANLRYSPNVDRPVQVADLDEQVRIRDAQVRERRLAELNQESAYVNRMVDEGKSMMHTQDQVRRAKQEEAKQLLKESEEASFQAYYALRRREEAEERLAKEQLDEMESRRRFEASKKQELLQDRMQRPQKYFGSLTNDVLSQIPSDSALHEAVRRVLDAHEHDVDVVTHLLRDIISEPEFSSVA